MSTIDGGVRANHTLVPIINGLHGKEVLVETKDRKQFVGLFAGCSPTLQIGLKFAYKKTAENHENILPKKKDTLPKLMFNFADIVSLSAIINEEKIVKGFATDREYHNKSHNRSVDEVEDLEVWECDEEDEIEIHDTNLARVPDRSRPQKNGGWSVDEMFTANSQLGVRTTFADDLHQYTTAEVEGSEEDRLRAEKIAREIENSSKSQYYSRLENDDDERDLDKQTTEKDFEVHQGKRGNYNNNRRGGGAVNRRADGMKGGTSGRGGGTNNRYGSGQGYAQRGQTYVAGANKRPTGTELHEQFNDWESGRKESAGKVYENSQLKAHQSHAKGGEGVTRSNNAVKAGAEKSGTQGGAARRADNLREWNSDFSSTFRGSKNETTPEKEAAPQESPARPVTSNAWTKGPPTSLLNSQQHPVSTPSVSPSPTSAVSQGNTVVHSKGGTNSQPTSSTAKPVSSTTDQTPSSSVQVDAKAVNEAAVVNKTEEKVAADAPASENGEDAGGKKFSFNPDAPVFTPRPSAPVVQAPQVVPLPQPHSMLSMAAVSMAAIPAGVPVQSGPPPAVVTAMPGQPVMVPSWQGAAAYTPVQVQGQYQPYVMNGQTVMALPQRTGVPAQPIAYAPPPNQRRPNGPQTSAGVMMPGGQWQNHVVMQQGVVPYAYSSYPMAAGAPPQQYATNAQMLPQAHQHLPSQGVYPPRYGAPMQPYVMPGQPRFSTPQQNPHQGHDGYQGAQTSTSAGHGSQPSTPGPQQPQPVPSPAQNMYYPAVVYSTTGSTMAMTQAQPSHQESGHIPQQNDGSQGNGGASYYSQQQQQQQSNSQQQISRQSSVAQSVYGPQGGSPPGVSHPQAQLQAQGSVTSQQM